MPAGDAMASATRSSTVTFTAVLSVARRSAARAPRCGGDSTKGQSLAGGKQTAAAASGRRCGSDSHDMTAAAFR